MPASQSMLKPKLCLFMFLQYFIWGCWYVSMGAYLTNRLGFEGGLVVAAMSHRIGYDYKGFPDGLHPDDEGKRRRSETVSARADAEGRLALATAPQDCLICLPER